MKYDQIAPYIHLSAERAGSDIQRVEVFRSRIPDAMFREIITDVDESLTQYGPLDDHDNEETFTVYCRCMLTFFSDYFCC